MNVAELVNNLTEQGVQLWADDEKLKVNCPKGVLTSQLKADIAARKSEILAFLREDSEPNCKTDTGLSLQTIGRLIGGFCEANSRQFKSPVIDPPAMAKQLKVTFRPLPKNFKNETILSFREDLEKKLQSHGVKVLSWEEATREFSYNLSFPLIPWKKSIKTRVVKPDVNAVFDVDRPVNRFKTFLAEKIYQFYSKFINKGQKNSVATIAKLINWAEDRTIQILEDPTSTQVILLSEIDRNFTDRKLPYQEKIAIGVNTLVKNFSEIAIGISEREISILNMNLSDSIFEREKFDEFVLKSLIPKIYVPIAPLPMSQFEVGKYNPAQSDYAVKLTQLSKELAKTGLLPSGFKLAEIVKRQSHRDIIDSIVNGRTGVSYGFVAYAEPPQYIGDREISQNDWENLASLKGYSREEVRQNELGRRYIKTQIADKTLYQQIPDIWLVCSRSGANKTNLNLESDILRLGLKNQLCLQTPEGIDPSTVDIKPSYDTYVMVAIALAAALYAPEAIEQGAPMVHFHGYPSKKWFESHEYFAGVKNPSVPCGTYESGVFNFLSIYEIAKNGDREMALATLIEPDHGSNIVTRNLDYLLTRLEAGIKEKQIELGGKHFTSLIS
jgi:hypothetical protein